MKTESLPFICFLRWFVIALLTGSALVVAFVALVDPYGVYGFLEVDGLNAVKPGLTRYHDEIKLAQAIKIRPNGIILGNSRAEIGFDPESSFLPQSSAPSYNLAIPGASISTAKRQLEHLHEAGINPKTVLMGVEFLDFLLPAGAVATSDSDLGLTLEKNEHSAVPERWRFDALFSLTSVVDAARTLLIQSNDDVATMTRKGFNPLKEYRSFARHDGYHAMFRQRARENAKAYMGKSPSVKRMGFQELRAILDLSAKIDAQVRLIVYPYHAQILILFEETGLWKSFEEWKNLLVVEVDAARRRHPNVDIRLIDFSGYSVYNCERIPEGGEHPGTTSWYWEAGHFKKELGDLVLQSTFESSSERGISDSVASKTRPFFGTELNMSTSLYNKHRTAMEREECAREFPALFSDTRMLVRELRDGER